MLFLAPGAAYADIVTLTPNQPLLKLSNGLQYVEAPDGDYSLASALAISNQRWKTSYSSNLNLSYTERPYWFRTTLRNPGKEVLRRQLEFAYPVLDYIELFVIASGGQVKRQVMSDKLPFESRPYPHRNFVVPLEIHAGETLQLYIRVHTSSALQMPLHLWQADAREAHDQKQLLQGLYFGTMLVMLIYNLILFFGIRDWNYLLYVLWITFIGGFLASFNGLAFQYLWPHATEWNDQSIVVLLSLANVFGICFSIAFLQLKQNLPRAMPAFQSMILMALLSAPVALWLPYQLAIKFAIFNAVISILLIMAVAIHLWTAGFRPARLFILSWSSVLIGGVILAMNKFGLLPSNLFTEHAAQVGSALEAILLSLAMVDRFNNERKSSERARLDLLHAQQALLDSQRKQNEVLENRVRERTEELEKANQKLQEMSSTDALTGTRNRRYFDQAYSSELKRMQRDGTDLSLLLLDIDHFKRINDTWGHQIGDECLRLVAQTIGQHIRRDSDTLARVGGEEFCILLPNTSAAGAIFLGEAIRNAVAALSPEISGQHLNISISIGIASSSQQLPTPPEQLLNLADKALYRAKQLGRNRVELFEPTQDQGTA
ncbi:MAG: diguanylate cyclase [Chitinivorax sp.]